MKLKCLAIILSAVLAAGILAGCGEGSSDTGSGSSIQQTEENIIYGEITEIGEDSVTINVGTRQKMEKPEEAENQVISQPGTKNDDESAAPDTTDADSLTTAKAASDAAKAVSEELSSSVSENV